MDSKAGEDYPAELRFPDERGISAIQITSSGELSSSLDAVLEDGFLSEHVKLVARQPQWERRK